MLKKNLIFLLILPVLLIPVYAQENTTEIPEWVKGVANFWVEGNIDDNEFGEAITFLIEQGIFKIDSVAISEPIQDMSDNEKRLFQLEIAQYNATTTSLQNQVNDIGAENSALVTSNTEKDGIIKSQKDTHEKYKEDYPLKIGDIGGMLVTDYIQQLKDEIKELKKK